jgi:ADP-ribose pyrophosphatase YjhB (NUDIX family)
MSYLARPRFCPRCGSRLVRREDDGHLRPTCPACGLVLYRNPAPAAGVVLLESGRVLMVKRRYAPAAGAWCLPAGFMEYGETPRRCARRELLEETGMTARLTGLFGVYAGMDDPRVRAVLILFRAARTGGRLRPGSDAIAVRFFPLARLPRRVAFAAHRRALAELKRLLADAPAERAPRPRRKRRGPARKRRASRPRRA